MRIVCLCNNWLGWQVLQWLGNQRQEIVGVVVHPAGQGKCLDEIRSVAKRTGCVVVEDSFLSEPEGLAQIRSCKADMAVSVLFRNILRKPFLDLFPKGCINLHPAYLPYNRGNYPNVWSIVEKTPAGVTLHYIDEGLDTGDIIAQEKVAVEMTDTGGTLYRKLELAALELFQRAWPGIESGNPPRRPQGAEPGTSHRRSDVEDIDEIDLGRKYRAEDLINILRARTFPPYGGAYFRENGKKVYLGLELSEEPVSDGGQARDQRTGEIGSRAGRDDKPRNSD
jgi:methionyl-tRNA formyltransferase